MITAMYALAVFAFLAYVVAVIAENSAIEVLLRRWRKTSTWIKYIVVLLILGATFYGGAKAPIVPEKILSFMFFDPSLEAIFPTGVVGESKKARELMLGVINGDLTLGAAADNSSNAVFLAAQAIAETNSMSMITLAADWPHTERPEPANIIASQIWVEPTNVVGELYENRYIEFSSVPSESPRIVVNYMDQRGNSVLVEPITNSFPTLVGINVQSGSHSCYWFRVKVPDMFRHNLRTWEDDVKFGGPIGSGYGFEVAGIIVFGSAGEYWRGIDAELTIGGDSLEFSNGVLMPPVLENAASENEPRMQPLLRGTPGNAKIEIHHNEMMLTDGYYEEKIKLAFPVKE